MAYKTFIGIDPGKKGAIAIISPDGLIVEPFVITTETDIERIDVNHISHLIEPYKKDCPLVVIERVGAMPKNGVVSMFNFGFTCGQIEACVNMLGYPMQYVRPQAWKKLVLGGARINWKGRKKSSADFCKKKYPKFDFRKTEQCTTVHDGMTDAVCIAEYGRILERDSFMRCKECGEKCELGYTLEAPEIQLVCTSCGFVDPLSRKLPGKGFYTIENDEGTVSTEYF